jgi:hypothetical protein
MVNRAMFMAALCCAIALTTALGSAGQAQPTPSGAQRFDELVRADFFAGVAGDAAALDRAMRLIEATLDADPRRPDVLVWHGSGLMVRAAQAVEKGDIAAIERFWKRGLDEMNQAVALAPDNVAVLIPRGATLLEVSRSVPDADQARSCWRPLSPITRRCSPCRRPISSTCRTTHEENSCLDSPKGCTVSANTTAPALISSVCCPRREARHMDQWPQHG